MLILELISFMLMVGRKLRLILIGLINGAEKIDAVKPDTAASLFGQEEKPEIETETETEVTDTPPEEEE